MQENILAKYPDADLRVYAVWVPVLATDERFAVADLMVDERVRHFWDGGQFVGEELRRLTGQGEGEVVWDVVAAFGPAATWREQLPEPLTIGAPVVDVTAELTRALEPYLRRPA